MAAVNRDSLQDRAHKHSKQIKVFLSVAVQVLYKNTANKSEEQHGYG